MRRENWIDWAKTLGILLVVMGHSTYAEAEVVRMVFMVHMPIFFFVSGYLFNTQCTRRELARKNWRTLFVPYLLFNAVSVAYTLLTRLAKLAGGGTVDWEFSVLGPLRHTLLCDAPGMCCGPTWFLIALIWCKFFTHALHTSRSRLAQAALLASWGGGSNNALRRASAAVPPLRHCWADMV